MLQFVSNNKMVNSDYERLDLFACTWAPLPSPYHFPAPTTVTCQHFSLKLNLIILMNLPCSVECCLPLMSGGTRVASSERVVMTTA